MTPQILTVSSKGQITLPISFRNMLSIEKGSKIAAFATGDSIMLKPVAMPSVEEFEAACEKAQRWAAEAGFGAGDIAGLISAARENASAESKPSTSTATAPATKVSE